MEQTKPNPMATKKSLLDLTKAKHPYADEESCIFALMMLNFPKPEPPDEWNVNNKYIELSTVLKGWNMINPDINRMYFKDWQIPRYRYMLQCMKQLGKPLPTEKDIHEYRQNCQLLDLDSEEVNALIHDGLIISDKKSIVVDTTAHVHDGKILNICREFNNRETALQEIEDDYDELFNLYMYYYSADDRETTERYSSEMYNRAIKHLSDLNIDLSAYLSKYTQTLGLCSTCDKMMEKEKQHIENITMDCLIILYQIKLCLIAILEIENE
jgi:hypothetical protein